MLDSHGFDFRRNSSNLLHHRNSLGYSRFGHDSRIKEPRSRLPNKRSNGAYAISSNAATGC
jgi:hypothetical protein